MVCLLLTLVACKTEIPEVEDPVSASPSDEFVQTPPIVSDNGLQVPPEPDEPFPGKIAIITNTVDQTEEEFRSAEAMQKKYGADKIILRTWPVNISTEGEQMLTILQQLAADPEIKAVIINQATINTNAAVDKLLEVRDDVFIVYCTPAEYPLEAAARANLLISTNDPLIGESVVMQAKLLGAEVFVHYSFPRHMASPMLAIKRDTIKATCEREGIRFVDINTPDPAQDLGIPGTQQFILEDVPKQVAAYGKNTAFISTNCATQVPLITKVIDEGAIFPLPCCPSPYHGFPAALDISARVPTGEFDESGNEIIRLRNLNEVVQETRNAITAKGASDRLSTWLTPVGMMWTYAGTEYAIKWINGEVDKYDIDYDVFADICAEYSLQVTGTKIGVKLAPLSLDGMIFMNFVTAVIDADYLTY